MAKFRLHAGKPNTTKSHEQNGITNPMEGMDEQQCTFTQRKPSIIPLPSCECHFKWLGGPCEPLYRLDGWCTMRSTKPELLNHGPKD